MSSYIQQLQSELTTDPLGLGYGPLLAAQADGSVVALISSQNYSQNITVDIGTLRVWASLQNTPSGVPFLAAVAQHAAANTPGTTDALAPVCYLAQTIIGVNGFVGLATNDSTVTPMIAALVSGGLLSSAQAAALEAMGVAPASRAEVLWGFGFVVSAADVAAVRAL